MPDLHRLLKRQLRKFFGDAENVPEELLPFIEAINQSYQHHESDRALIERAMEMSSKELTTSNKKLLDESKTQKILIDSLKDSLRSISSSNVISDDNDLLKIADLLKIEIEQRKNAEAQIIASEEKYRGIIENMDLGMMETDANGVVVNVYDRFLEMTGYSADELMGKDPKIILLDKDSVEALKIQEQFRKKGEFSVYEIQMTRKDGEKIWVIVSGAPIFDAQGKVTGSVGMHFDITHRKQIEADLEKAKATAEASLKSKDLFLANISHEIRTPMNAIIGMSRLLAESPLNSTQKEYLKAVSTSARGLMVIINDVLDMSKIKSGKFTMETIDVDLDHLLKGVKQAQEFKAEEKGIYLHVKRDERIKQYLKSDPTRLVQILTNLVSNAIKFTKKGGVDVQVDLIKETRGVDQVRFTVKDSGIGIDKEKLASIFESFTQEDETITRKFGGTGLGLAISRQLVDLFGGSLKVSSEKNKGSEFSFVISMAHGNEPEKKRKQKNEIKDLREMRILLVEDNEINQFLAVTILKRWNALVDTALNGLEAVDAVKEANYDVILMDMQMPEMDGIEATKVIRTELEHATPIIALTANAVKGEKDKCISAGMNDYLSKPFDQEELYSKIARFNNFNNKLDTPPKTDSDKIVHRFSLQKLLEMYQGEKQFVRRTVEIFLNQFETDMLELQQSWQEQDLENIKHMAHKIKPNIDLFEIIELKDEVRDIERQAEDGAAEGLDIKIQNLDRVMREVGEEMKSFLN